MFVQYSGKTKTKGKVYPKGKNYRVFCKTLIVNKY